jgi:hypothetical protein
MLTPPTVLLGFIKDQVRLESNEAGEFYPEDQVNKVLFNQHPIPSPMGKPILWGVTHIQYRSAFGFLIKKCDAWWKLGFHVWVMPDLGDFDGTRHIPGTEQGWYFRFGRVWRPGLDKYEWSWYGPFNQHWD